MNLWNLKWLGFHYSVIKDNYRLAKFSNLLLTKLMVKKRCTMVLFFSKSDSITFLIAWISSLYHYIYEKRSSFLSWLIYREPSSFLFSHRSNILFSCFRFYHNPNYFDSELFFETRVEGKMSNQICWCKRGCETKWKDNQR